MRSWQTSHKIVNQLQFLPLLYARPDDKILVTHLPKNPDPRLCLIDNPPKNLEIEHWGPSRAIALWAKNHDIAYPNFDWDQISQINSKIFSYLHSTQLPGSELIETQEQLNNWLKKTPGPKILKTPFGTSGSGHIDPSSNVKQLYTFPLIGEPWVERVLDFSSQWKNGELIGMTICKNDSKGRYQGTYVGEIELWAITEHLRITKPLIEKMGYLDHIGVDAYIYLDKGEKRVHHIVEINARKTMSWVALQTPHKRLEITPEAEGVLPIELNGTLFSRNISIGITNSLAQEIVNMLFLSKH